MDLTATENIPGFRIFIDFQKAFDIVEWEFLIKCLEKFNFGPDFIRWVGVFYKYIKSCIINNGLLKTSSHLNVAFDREILYLHTFF